MTDNLTIYGKHVAFEPRPPKPKTKVWAVLNKYDGTLLGFVQWFAKWRKYSFFPEADRVFEGDCLRDMADFCDKRTAEHYGH